MMLGAAIGGGKSPDAWTNVFAGVEKALPSLINYRAKQTEAKRARQMGIAKMAITQKLSLEAEQRAETRGIRKEERGVARAIAAEERGVTRTIATEKRAAARKLLEINEYTTLKPHTVPASLFTEGAKGMITIPRMSFPLDSYGRQRMADWGISVVPVGKYTPKAADELASGRVKPIAELPLKQQNLLYQDPKPGDRIWEKFGSNFRPTYMTPKPAGVLSYGLKRRMAKEDFAAMHREYDTVRGNYGKLYDSLSELSKLDPKKLVGTGSIKERLGSAIAGLAGYNKNEKSFLNRWSNALLGDKDLSNIDLFETRGRILLARMAPIILGESGKTISDRDRVRVARSLGFEVDAITNDDGSVTFGQITGFNSKILANPETIRAAIQQTAGILSDRMEEMHKIYQRETDGIAVNIPDLELKEILGKRKVKPRLKFNLIAPIS